MFRCRAWIQAIHVAGRQPMFRHNAVDNIGQDVAGSARLLSSTPWRASEKSKRDPYQSSSTAPTLTDKQAHEGTYSRTDRELSFEYPDGGSIPRNHIAQGRGGPHMKRTLPTFSLEGKVAVVTGGARGLGLAMGEALVSSGADLAIVDLNKEEAAHQATELVANFRRENPASHLEGDDCDSKFTRTPKITSYYCDVASPSAVSSALSEIIQQHGKIDNLVTSAGFTENFDAIAYPYDRMKKLWGVNVDGTYLFATGVAKHLMERNEPGSIVMIGSMSGAIVNVPQPQAPYNAAKAAVRHLAASLAVEWAHANIRVNCISPGYMLSPLTRKVIGENPDLKRQWTSLIPMGKMGRPEDLMGAVTFLLSEASAYVTGADLRVDGGYTVT